MTLNDVKNAKEKVETYLKELRATLTSFADELDKEVQHCRGWKATEAGAGVVGGVLTVVGGALTIATLGAGAPVLLAGVVVGGVGAGTGVTSSITESVVTQKKRKTIQKMMEEYNDALEDLNRKSTAVVVCLKVAKLRDPRSASEDFKAWTEKNKWHWMTDIKSWMIGFINGHPDLVDNIDALMGSQAWPTLQVLCKGAQITVKGILEHVSKDALKVTMDEVIKATCDSYCKNVTENILKSGTGCMDNILNVSAKATTKSGQEAAENAAKTAAEVSGGIAVGVGVFFLPFDIYTMATNIKKICKKKPAEASSMFRQIAQDLEIEM